MSPNLPIEIQILIILLNILALALQGIALWRSAKLEQKNWFIANLIVGTVTGGILPAIYLFKFAKKPLTIKEMRSWLPKRSK